MSGVVHVAGFDRDSVLDDELRTYMAQAGVVVDVEVLPSGKASKSNRQAGRSNGRAKVSYSLAHYAVRACRELDGITMHTTSMESFDLSVTPFREAPASPTPSPRAISRSDLKLFVSWSSKGGSWTEDDVHAVFKPRCGTIVAVVMGKSRSRLACFANVWLRDPCQGVLDKVRASSKEQPVELLHEGWRLWLQLWAEPNSSFSWGTTGGSSPARVAALSAPRGLSAQAVGAALAPATPDRGVGGAALSPATPDRGARGAQKDDEQTAVRLAKRHLANLNGASTTVTALVVAMYNDSAHGDAAKRALSGAGGAQKFLRRVGPREGIEVLSLSGAPIQPDERTTGYEGVRLTSRVVTTPSNKPATSHERTRVASRALFPQATAAASSSPRAPPTAAADGGGGEGLVQQVERIKATLELPASTSMIAALREANVMMGNAGDDEVASLPESAARLLKQLGI